MYALHYFLYKVNFIQYITQYYVSLKLSIAYFLLYHLIDTAMERSVQTTQDSIHMDIKLACSLVI